MAHSESLWDSRVHRPDRQELLPQLHLQRGKQQLNFQVKTGGRQGCVMSAVLFNLVIELVMQRLTEEQPRGIRWTLFDTLEDLDFVDDLALVSHPSTHVREDTPSQQVWSTGRTANQQEKNGDHDLERECSRPSLA